MFSAILCALMFLFSSAVTVAGELLPGCYFDSCFDREKQAFIYQTVDGQHRHVGAVIPAAHDSSAVYVPKEGVYTSQRMCEKQILVMTQHGSQVFDCSKISDKQAIVFNEFGLPTIITRKNRVESAREWVESWGKKIGNGAADLLFHPLNSFTYLGSWFGFSLANAGLTLCCILPRIGACNAGICLATGLTSLAIGDIYHKRNKISDKSTINFFVSAAVLGILLGFYGLEKAEAALNNLPK